MPMPDGAVAERIRAAVAAAPAKMTLQLARDLGVPEVEVLRAFPENRAVELDISRWEEIIRALEDIGTVHVVVSNGATTLEAVGDFGGFSTWGEFFNVQTKTLDMHLRYRELDAAFAVEKPSHMNGVSTLSFQFFDRGGHAALKVFLNFGNEAAPETLTHFQRIREQFRRHPS